MKTATTVLLTGVLVGGVSGGRVLQDIPEVGLGPARPPTTSSASQTESEYTTKAREDEEDLIDAIEADDQVTVVSEIEFDKLLCESLGNAEDAALLSFFLLQEERVIAEQTSYIVTDGDAFTDGIGRKVWTGVVVDPARGEDEAVPRTVSMTWGEVCDPETFLLKVTKRNLDDTTSIVKTIPCFGSTSRTCLLEVEVQFEEVDDALIPDDIIRTSITAASDGGSSSTSDTSSREANASTTTESSSRRRQLQTDTVIDVMVLYSVSSLIAQGGLSSQQMETIILESLVGTNQALVNSEVSVYFNPVHIGLLPYEVTTSDSATTLLDFQANANVGALRDLVGADLVQMVGDFDNTCGRSFSFNSNEVYGYSIVKATCFGDYAHTHVFGHNLGCHHNRDDTSFDNEYAHAYRYCDGEDPYRTIMSYSCGTPRVNYFSNPDVTFLDKPTGTPRDDNARAIEDNIVAVSNYRNQARPPTPAPCTTPPTTAPPTTTPPTPTPTTPSPTTISPTFPPTTNAPPSPAPTTTPPTPTPTTAPLTTTPPTPAPTPAPFITVPPTPTPITTPPTTTAPPTTLPPTTGYTLVGCYEDNSRDHVLSGRFVKEDRTMTTEVCVEFCLASPYFGTEYRQELLLLAAVSSASAVVVVAACWCLLRQINYYVFRSSNYETTTG